MNQQHKALVADVARQHGEQAFQVAYRILGDVQLAEDITQDVFLKLFTQPLKSLKKVRSWPAYLKTLASRAAIDQLRRRRSRREESASADMSLLDEVSEEVIGPGRLVENAQLLERLRAAIALLTLQDAQIFWLRFIEGFSYREIATALEITSNHVGVVLHRVQPKLVEHLAGITHPLEES